MLPVIQGNINGRIINAVSAKALHEALGVEVVIFSTWIIGRVNEYAFVEGTDYQSDDDFNIRFRLLNETIFPVLGNNTKTWSRPEKGLLINARHG